MLLPDPICFTREQATEMLGALDGARLLLDGTVYLVGLLAIEAAAFLIIDKLMPGGS